MEAQDLMTSPVVTIRMDATVGEAAQVMLDGRVSCLPVLDGQENLVGILTHHDFAIHIRYHPLADQQYIILGITTTPAHIEEVSRQVSTKLVEEVMHQPVITVRHDAPISEVAELILREQIHRLPIVRDSAVVGIITRHDFLKLIVEGESSSEA